MLPGILAKTTNGEISSGFFGGRPQPRALVKVRQPAAATRKLSGYNRSLVGFDYWIYYWITIGLLHTRGNASNHQLLKHFQSLVSPFWNGTCRRTMLSRTTLHSKRIKLRAIILGILYHPAKSNRKSSQTQFFR